MELKNDPDSFLLSSKRILITGASGFIGTHLTHRLCSMGAEVHGTSRTQRESHRKNLKWWKGAFDNLDEAKKLYKAIKPDLIFHMAGEVTAAGDPKFIIPTYHSLLTSSVNLLTLALENGCQKVVLAGSCTEPDPLNPVPSSPYAAAKLATGIYGHLFDKTYNLPVTVVRPFMGYGPLQPKTKLIPHVILSLLKGEDTPLTSGSWLTDWIYIEDLVDGILAAAVTKQRAEKNIDLASGELISVRGIVEKIVEIMKPSGKPIFGALPDRPMEKCLVSDLDYTYQMTGWKPKTSLEKGLRRTIEWYKKNLELKEAKTLI